MAEQKRKSYEEITETHPELKDVISENSWNFISHSDKKTLDLLGKLWIGNLRKNISSKRYKRHGSLADDCLGFGKNKAIIGIGAGPSLNKNKHILKQLHDYDGIKHPNERDFIFIASNHMFKPLLKEDIIPDFIMLADASDVVYDQLTKDIPESGRNCVLIAGLQCHPKVLKKWEKQGRDIRFYLTSSPGLPEEYEKLTNKNANAIIIQQGGNVLNSCWSMGLKFFKSSVFMALGNDLSYPMEKDLEKRRKEYYADGDYSTNLATKRDEAKDKKIWMGYSQERTKIITHDSIKRYDYELDFVGTTANLWVYKTWIESNVLANANDKRLKYKYFNCTEGGICGVLCKSNEPSEMEKLENWFLLDQKCSKWRTWMFEDAIEIFLKAKKELKNKWRKFDAHDAIAMAQMN